MSFSWRLLLVCALALQAATCGQRGALKLPQTYGGPPPATSATAASAAATYATAASAAATYATVAARFAVAIPIATSLATHVAQAVAWR